MVDDKIRADRLVGVRLFPPFRSATGQAWLLSMRPDQGLAGAIDLDQPLFHASFPPQPRLIRIGSQCEIVAVLGGADDNRLRIFDTSQPGPEVAINREMDGRLMDEVSDMAVSLVQDTGHGQGAIVYLALPAFGQISIFYFYLDEQGKPQATSHSLDAVGTPDRLFLSPDCRRLYVTYTGEARVVGILEVGCEQPAACERLVTNLQVPSWPDQVVFTPTGERAFVTHWFNSELSVIE